jgi:protease-4
MTVETVDEHAQGRVWTGADAQNVGLVDELGGMDKALQLAAGKAGIEDYKVDRYPKAKTLYEVFMSSTAAQARALLNESWLINPATQKAQNQLQILKNRGALTLFPYDINIE